MHPLDGPRLKVVRAREHIQDIYRQQIYFFKGNPYFIGYRRQGNKHVYRIFVHDELPRHRLATLVGDCVHNLRSALDHIVWRLSEDFGGPNPNDRRTLFPIFETEPGYNERGIQRLERVGPGVAAVIRALQPFHDDDPTMNPLWFVGMLDNSDKHRELAVTAVAAKSYGHRISSRPGETGTFNLTLSLEDIKDGVVIAEVTIFPVDAKVTVQPQFEFEVALTEPTVPRTEQRLFVVSFLDVLATTVSAVIQCFDPFYATGRYDDEVVIDDPTAPLHRPPRLSEAPRSAEFHHEWAMKGRERINAGVDDALGELKPKLAESIEAAIMNDLRPALQQVGLNGFLAGMEMTLERADELRCEEMSIPPEETEQ